MAMRAAPVARGGLAGPQGCRWSRPPRTAARMGMAALHKRCRAGASLGGMPGSRGHRQDNLWGGAHRPAEGTRMQSAAGLAGAGATTAFELLGLATALCGVFGSLAVSALSLYAGALGLKVTWLFFYLRLLGRVHPRYPATKADAWRAWGELLALMVRLRAAAARVGAALSGPHKEALIAGLAVSLSAWAASSGRASWGLVVGAETAAVATVGGWAAAGSALRGGAWSSREERAVEQKLEENALAALHKGNHHCAWKADAYDTEGKLSNDVKAEVNARLAAGAAVAARQGGGWGWGGSLSRASALVLDADSAQTSEALIAEGFRPGMIRTPNALPQVSAALRGRGLRSWVGDVGDWILSRDPAAEPFVFVDLDYCGGPPQRLPHLRALFERHVVADGGLLAVALSFNGVGKGEDAVEVTADAVEGAARRHGYRLERWEFFGTAPWAPHMLCVSWRVFAERPSG